MSINAAIAKWLYDRIIADDYVLQSEAVAKIAEKFGEQYTYTNVNGNPAISKAVLKEFAKIKNDDIVWDRTEKTWHVKTDADRELERMADEVMAVELPKVDFPTIDAGLLPEIKE